MRLKYAVLADFATRDQQGKAILIGVFDRLVAPQVPIQREPFFLHLDFEAGIGEGTEHRVDIDVVDSNGQRVLNPAPFRIQLVPGGPGRPLTGNSNIKIVGARFNSFDDYQFRIWGKGQCLGTAELIVMPLKELPGYYSNMRKRSSRCEPTPKAGGIISSHQFWRVKALSVRTAQAVIGFGNILRGSEFLWLIVGPARFFQSTSEMYSTSSMRSGK